MASSTHSLDRTPDDRVFPRFWPRRDPSDTDTLTLDGPVPPGCVAADELRRFADALEAEAEALAATRRARRKVPVRDLLRSEGWTGALRDTARRARTRADELEQDGAS